MSFYINMAWFYKPQNINFLLISNPDTALKLDLHDFLALV